jgi:endo-1,4-beta-xylanase
MNSREVVEAPNKDHNFIKVTNVHNPTITVYLPAAKQAAGAAIVVCPGGGHRMLAMHEGYDIGRYLADRGIAAFVLKYRLAREEGSKYKIEEHALMDVQRAIRMVRSRAKEWGVESGRVGVMGFSAGGEVALLAATRFDKGNDASSDPVERQGSRPDFQVLVYPGIRPERFQITKETSPAFLICAFDDNSPADSLPLIFTSLKKAGVNAELHIYAKGGHGFGMRDRPIPVSSWNARLMEWMSDRGYLAKQ